MLPTLGHCEDPACAVSSSRELVRLFRCSIHCDRNLCLYHLNAHNVYYEEEKKQNDIVICELQKCLNLYQTIFEQQMLAYRELVRQASTILLHNTSSLVPIDQIRPVIGKIQEAIAVFQGEKIIIKCESLLDGNDGENEKTKSGNTNVSGDSDQKVVVRIPRIDCGKNNIASENEIRSNHDDSIIRFKEYESEQAIQSAHVAKKPVSLKRKHK
ncbi:unnamed protein product [Rotaria sp. Silwood2]|nr:unnamed protein product [Rotaria sp. Silwood2]CAF3428164.1 unnamed protein product [Rotaria sp. Silwood2]CAF4307181.1 unnamed protein product [Rotaria sp. Silwood2]